MALSDPLKQLIPPDQDDHKGQSRWRWYIFIAVLLLLVHAGASSGLLPGGFGEHAPAADLKIVLELQIAETIRELQKEKCEMPPERRGRMERVIDDYQRRYKEITGQRYPVQRCNSSD